MATKKSQVDKVLNHLIRYRRITSWQAIQKFRITRLSSIIHIMRNKYGLQITSEMVYKKDTRYVIYKLI